jgi:hypothetical protein
MKCPKDLGKFIIESRLAGILTLRVGFALTSFTRSVLFEQNDKTPPLPRAGEGQG